MPDLRVPLRRLSGGGDGAGATRTRFAGVVNVEPRTRGPLRVSVLPERLASAGTTCSPRQTVIQDDAAATCGPLQVSIPPPPLPPVHQPCRPSRNRETRSAHPRIVDRVKWFLLGGSACPLHRISLRPRYRIGYTVRNRVAKSAAAI